MKIGIYGGTFDPVHLGHIAVARLAMERVDLGCVQFVPSAHPPHKNGVVHTSGPDRMAMLSLAIGEEARFVVNDIELEPNAPQYTVDTMRALRRAYPREQLYFIIGGDSLLYLDEWHESDALLRETPFIAICRPQNGVSAQRQKAEALLREYGADITLVEWQGMPISSTAIREFAGQGRPVAAYTGEAVAAYIHAHGLYRSEAP